MWPKSVLMVTPEGFRVDYAINPYMKDSNGNLQVVDTKLAQQQWTFLKNKFEELGLLVQTLPGDLKLPDMVFCANQTLPFINEKGEKSILLGRMHSDKRKPESEHFKNWANKNQYTVYHLNDCDFEGCGDAIWNYETGEIYGGSGFRTQSIAYDQIESILNIPIKRLELVNPHFYHLDTCFVILNKTTVAYVEEAFSEKSLNLIKSSFENRIIIQLEEALQFFAGNALCVNGQDVLLQKGAKQFVKDLQHLNFKTHELDVSEFLKSGGAVFCMKQMLF